MARRQDERGLQKEAHGGMTKTGVEGASSRLSILTQGNEVDLYTHDFR